jgi:hypothetical protein
MGVKISELPASAGAALGMQFEVNNAGTSERLTLAQMFALSTGAVVADTPLLNFAQTWNNGAVAFNAFKLNITDAASAAASLLMDLQVGGATKFKVDKSGGLHMPAGTFITALGAGNLTITPSSGWPLQIASSGGLLLPSSGAIRWSVFPETQLVSSTTGVLEQRNGANAQTFRVYSSYGDASNNGGVEFASSGAQQFLRTFKNGTGGAGTVTSELNIRSWAGNVSIGPTGGDSLYLVTANTQRWNVNSAGHFLAFADNSYDIGASGANRPRDLFLANDLTCRDVSVSNRVKWAAASGTSPVTPDVDDGYVEIEVSGSLKLIPYRNAVT